MIAEVQDGGIKGGGGIIGNDFVGGLALAALEASHLPEQARGGRVHSEGIHRIITTQGDRFQGGARGWRQGQGGEQNEHVRLWHIDEAIVSPIGLDWQANPCAILGRGSGEAG